MRARVRALPEDASGSALPRCRHRRRDAALAVPTPKKVSRMKYLSNHIRTESLADLTNLSPRKGESHSLRQFRTEARFAVAHGHRVNQPAQVVNRDHVTVNDA